MNNRLIRTLTAISLFSAASWAAADPAAWPVRLELGLTASSGVSDLADKIELNNPAFTAASISPLGLSAGLYYAASADWDLTASIGPVILGRGDASFSVVPIGLGLRYALIRSEESTTYLLAGVEKALASGDFVSGASAGGVVGIAYDFASHRQGGWSVALALHSTPVTVSGASPSEDLKARPYKATLSARYIF